MSGLFYGSLYGVFIKPALVFAGDRIENWREEHVVEFNFRVVIQARKLIMRTGAYQMTFDKAQLFFAPPVFE